MIILKLLIFNLEMGVKEKKSYLGIYFKGLLMGIADLIPGISGGTIAFIVGIYQRLIKSLKNISFTNYFNLFLFFKNRDKKKFREEFLRLDILFLFILVLGIFSSILSFSHLISYLLENYLVFLLSFFIGLILMSSKVIFKEVTNPSKKNLLFSLIGFIFGFSFIFLPQGLVSNPSFIFVMVGGFLAMFALFLPGVSGSFILLLLGLYEYIINVVKEIQSRFIDLIPFILGAIVGVAVISRLVDFLFRVDKSKTLLFLLGLVLGSLFVPLKNILELIEFNSFNIVMSLFLFFVGCLVVYLLEKYGN